VEFVSGVFCLISIKKSKLLTVYVCVCIMYTLYIYHVISTTNSHANVASLGFRIWGSKFKI
jgi:hypothetical protein